MNKTITTAEAVEQIAKELNNDKNYYFSWQSNIAVSFIDELRKKGYELPDQYEIANKAAKAFLDRFINTKINLDNRQEIVGVNNMNEPKTVKPIGPYVYDTMAFESKLNQNSGEPLSLTGIMQRVDNRMIILRPVNGSRPEGFEYEGEGEVLKVLHDPLVGTDTVVEVVKVKGWNSTINDDEKLMHIIKKRLIKL